MKARLPKSKKLCSYFVLIFCFLCQPGISSCPTSPSRCLFFILYIIINVRCRIATSSAEDEAIKIKKFLVQQC